jgi:hypothetical protein
MKTEEFIKSITDMFHWDIKKCVITKPEFEDSFDNHLSMLTSKQSMTTSWELYNVFNIVVGNYVPDYPTVYEDALRAFASIDFAKTFADIIWSYAKNDGIRFRMDCLIRCYNTALRNGWCDALNFVLFTNWERISEEKRKLLKPHLRSTYYNTYYRFVQWQFDTCINDYIGFHLHDAIFPIDIECKALMLKWKQKHPEKESEDFEL